MQFATSEEHPFPPVVREAISASESYLMSMTDKLCGEHRATGTFGLLIVRVGRPPDAFVIEKLPGASAQASTNLANQCSDFVGFNDEAKASLAFCIEEASTLENEEVLPVVVLLRHSEGCTIWGSVMYRQAIETPAATDYSIN